MTFLILLTFPFDSSIIQPQQSTIAQTSPIKQEKHSFVELPQRLPGTLAPKLFGRVVEDFKRPTSDYHPEDPTSLFNLESIEVTARDDLKFRKHVPEATAKATLGHALGLQAGVSETSTAKLEGKKVITRTLTQQRDAFRAICDASNGKVEEMLRNNNGECWFIVGVMTICEATFEFDRSQSYNAGAEAKIPAGAAISSATNGAVNLGTTIGPSIDVGIIKVFTPLFAKNEVSKISSERCGAHPS